MGPPRSTGALPDGCTQSEREAERPGKTVNKVWVSYSFHYCKSNCSLGFKKKIKTHIKTFNKRSFGVEVHELHKVVLHFNESYMCCTSNTSQCAVSSHARSDVNVAVPAHMSCKRPLTHKMSAECQQFHCLFFQPLFIYFYNLFLSLMYSEI